MTTDFSETGYRYQLIVRGECGPLTESLFGEAAIETGNGCTSLIFSARDDSGTEAVPHLPLRASLAHPGLPPYTTAGPHNPPWGPAVLPRVGPFGPPGRLMMEEAGR